MQKEDGQINGQSFEAYRLVLSFARFLDSKTLSKAAFLSGNLELLFVVHL